METLINTFSLRNGGHNGESVGVIPKHPKRFHKSSSVYTLETGTVILIFFLKIMHFIIYYPKLQTIDWVVLRRIEYTAFF